MAIRPNLVIFRTVGGRPVSTASEIRDQIKSTYDGPLVLATDDMVFNVTKDYIKTRMMVAAEDVWPPESAKEALERDEVASFSGRGWQTDPDKPVAAGIGNFLL